MQPYKRGRCYHIDVRWNGYPRIRLSTKTSNKVRAQAMVNTLVNLRDAGRKDLIGLLAAGRVGLVELHEAYLNRGDELEQLQARAESPKLGLLINEWLEYLRSPAGVSPRTKRRYADQTIRRYRVSWEGFFEVLPNGRESRLSDITSGFIREYRNQRVRADGGTTRNTRKDGARPSAATINRDLVALSSFFRWCGDVKGLAVQKPKMVREREPQGRERWLSPEEIGAAEAVCPSAWWPLFTTLIHTGMRIGEAQGLLWGDVHLDARRISIHEGHRRVKTASSVRDVPITEPLAEVLARQSAIVRAGSADPVFPAPLNNYHAAYSIWRKVCFQAGLHDGSAKPKPNATIHDLRHTFGVSAAKAGVPLVRMQKLMGHASAHMTLRYMRHAPEAHFREDAASISDVLVGQQNREAEARAELARKGFKTA